MGRREERRRPSGVSAEAGSTAASTGAWADSGPSRPRARPHALYVPKSPPLIVDAPSGVDGGDDRESRFLCAASRAMVRWRTITAAERGDGGRRREDQRRCGPIAGPVASGNARGAADGAGGGGHASDSNRGRTLVAEAGDDDEKSQSEGDGGHEGDRVALPRQSDVVLDGRLHAQREVADPELSRASQRLPPTVERKSAPTECPVILAGDYLPRAGGRQCVCGRGSEAAVAQAVPGADSRAMASVPPHAPSRLINEHVDVFGRRVSGMGIRTALSWH